MRMWCKRTDGLLFSENQLIDRYGVIGLWENVGNSSDEDDCEWRASHVNDYIIKTPDFISILDEDDFKEKYLILK